MNVEHSFVTISPIELSCREDYIVDGRNTLRQGDNIVFNIAEHGAITTDLIFYGPYSTLSPGVHFFMFSGELDGELKVDFTHQNGTVVLKELTVDNFVDPVCLTVTKPLTAFEVRGYRTPSLNSMRLESISVETIRFSTA